MKTIKIRKWNEERKLYEIVFEVDNKDGEYEIATGKYDTNGKPTFVGDIIEGDAHTEFGVIKSKGVIQYDNVHQQFVCVFNVPKVFGGSLPVNNVKIIGNLKETK